MAASELSKLLDAAVREAIHVEGDPEAYWAAVGALGKRTDVEVLEAAYEWAASSKPALRELVPDVLRKLGGLSPFLDETIRLFQVMLERERVPSVIAAIGFATNDLEDPRMAGLLLPFANHPDATVREGVVHALSAGSCEELAPTLIALTRDPADDVRNWATFYLATARVEGELYDTPAVRKALQARLKDTSKEVQAEAKEGLKQRGKAAPNP